MQDIVTLLLQYRYFLILPLCIVEGPVIALAIGFLSTKGYLNVLLAYPLIVTGDIIGDSLCYLGGVVGLPLWLKRCILFFWGKSQRSARLKYLIKSNPRTYVALSKITPGIGVAGIYYAGRSRIPYLTFLPVSLFTSMGQYIVYLSLGAIAGEAYTKLAAYFNRVGLLLLLAVCLWLIIRFIKNVIQSS